MEKHNTCCFFGHRNTIMTADELESLKNIINLLILNHGVRNFLFGSRSNFYIDCHKIVTQLKETYPFIVRKCYTCKHETCVLEENYTYWKNIYDRISNGSIPVLPFDEEIEFSTKNTAGKASYVERNQALIDESDYFIFYYDETYQPKKRKRTKQGIDYYQPKSGTMLAYKYAKQKNKYIINIKPKTNK